MEIWLTIIAVGILTYGTRLSFILIFGRSSFPAPLQRALRFVPPAVLTAIIFPELFLPQGSLDVSLGNSRLLAGILAVLVAWRTKNVVITIAIGMVALLALEALKA